MNFDLCVYKCPSYEPSVKQKEGGAALPSDTTLKERPCRKITGSNHEDVAATGNLK